MLSPENSGEIERFGRIRITAEHYISVLRTEDAAAFKGTNTSLPIVHTSNTSETSICRRQFVNVFADCFCAVHTQQLEFTNFSFQCESRLK